MSRLDDLVSALRAADGEAPEVADATQLRVERSLERRARSRHRLVGVATTLAILFVGTVSWALATGQVSGLWTPAHRLDEAPPSAPPAPVSTLVSTPVSRSSAATVPRRAVPAVEQARLATSMPAVASAPVVAPPLHAEAARAADPPASAPRQRAGEDDEALYRAAHERHFRGGDPAEALRAWDAYLAAEPNGRFAVEARYNRGLALIRLGRYADARAALVPFALGSVDGDYRQSEARQLIERLAHAE